MEATQMSSVECINTTSANFVNGGETELGAWLISVHNVNVEESSFGAKVRLVFKFNSQKIAGNEPFKSAGSRTYYRPNEASESLPGQATEILNMISGGINRVSFYGDKQDVGLLFHEDGDPEHLFTLEMVYEGRFKHVFELQKFPFEVDMLSISFVFWCANEDDFQRSWQISTAKLRSPGGDRLDLPDFSVGEFGFDSSALDGAGGSVRCDFQIKLERKPWYYLISSTFSMIIIMLFSLATFGMSAEGNDAALGIVGSLLLATIAVRFVISQDTPRVPYTTHIDREAIATFFFLLFVAFVHTEFNNVIEGTNKIFAAGTGLIIVMIFMLGPIIKYKIRVKQ